MSIISQLLRSHHRIPIDPEATAVIQNIGFSEKRRTHSQLTQLAVQAQTDSSCVPELLSECLGMIIAIAQGTSHHVALSDLIQAGVLGLLKVLPKFDAERSSFLTFAAWGILQEIQLAATHPMGTYARVPRRHNKDTFKKASSAGLECLLAKKRVTLEPDMLNMLSERDRDILYQRAAGYTLAEIGKHIGITKERVRQLQASALQIVREAYL